MTHFSAQMLEGIDILAAVVDTRSFGRAGEALGMSQSGVSRAVERLEARLGIRVFDRTTRSVRLTEEGRRFYEEVMPLVGALAEVTARAAGGAAAVRGRLRVNIDPFFSSLILVRDWGPSWTATRTWRSNCAAATTWATWWPKASTWRFDSDIRGLPPWWRESCSTRGC
jgi:DNA-binding MarR family transcriptional regulator